MADSDDDIDIYSVSMDRHQQILNSVIRGDTPDEKETPSEVALRKQLEKEVREIRAKGGIPAMPFD